MQYKNYYGLHWESWVWRGSRDLVQKIPDGFVVVVVVDGDAMLSDGGDELRLLLQQRAESRLSLGSSQGRVDPLFLLTPPLWNTHVRHFTYYINLGLESDSSHKLDEPRWAFWLSWNTWNLCGWGIYTSLEHFSWFFFPNKNFMN